MAYVLCVILELSEGDPVSSRKPDVHNCRFLNERFNLTHQETLRVGDARFLFDQHLGYFASKNIVDFAHVGRLVLPAIASRVIGQRRSPAPTAGRR